MVGLTDMSSPQDKSHTSERENVFRLPKGIN